MLTMTSKISRKTTQLLSGIPVKFLSLDEKESKQIDGIISVIFNANVEEYGEAFCYEDGDEQVKKPESLGRFKAD